MQHPLLIDCETLQNRLGQPGLVILDVRGRSTYEFGGHIPGAVHSTWHEYSDPEAIAKGLLDPDLKRIEKRVQALGINQDSEVVIYSNPFDNWGDEGRMFWMLEYLGHTNIKVLDGGWVKWIHERRPFEHGAVRSTPGNFTVSPRASAIIMKDELKGIDHHCGCAELGRVPRQGGLRHSEARSYPRRGSCSLERIPEC